MEPSTITESLRQLAEQEPLEFRVSGDCMSPLIRDGAVVRITPHNTYWPGDVLVFRGRNGKLMAHRFLGCYTRRGKLCFLAKGDSAVIPDNSFERDHIVGRISGGSCAKETITVPLSRRLFAVGHFLKFAFTRAAPLVKRS